MRLAMRISQDPYALPLAFGTYKEVGRAMGVTEAAVRQQISKTLNRPLKRYIRVVFDDDIEREIMADEAMDLIRLRMESERRKAEETKGTPREFTYRHTANILRGILIDLEDFAKENNETNRKRKND